jgi:1-phosphatidylinositol-4-phosphate 5-kinase
MFGVNEYEFLLSVCGNANYIEFQVSGKEFFGMVNKSHFLNLSRFLLWQSNAKSGQFFFYSKDGKYMIKTMTNAESKFLRRSK